MYKQKKVMPIYVFILTMLCFCIIPFDVIAEPNDLGTSFEGGRGLLNMNSAYTFGKAHYVIGLQGLFMQREHPVLWKPAGEYRKDNPTIIGLPITLGLTDEIDVTGSLYYFHDSRPFLTQENVFDYYDSPTSGLGSARLAVKGRLPSKIANRLLVAGKIGATLDTSKEQIDGMNYRWTRAATDIDFSLLETFNITQIIDLHLEQGFVLAGDDWYEDRWVFAAGLEVTPTPKWSFGLELDTRTFHWRSPMVALMEGPYTSKYESASRIGDSRWLTDEGMDFGDDYVFITPSVRYQLFKSVSLNAGALINVAQDQADPKEKVQFNVGIAYGGAMDFLLDTDGDGVKNNKDREKDTPAGYAVDEFGVSLDTDKDRVPDGRDREINTPRGATVDQYGVGKDSDGDGVYDGIDKEPDTPKGATVDQYGVGKDTDGDGIYDGIDREVDTPKGAQVDQYGVGKDSDSDGVYDGIDRQPNTPRGAVVDQYGVALDGDNDSVPDGIDLEPNTPPGIPVDKFGRGIKPEEKKFLDEGTITVHKINFASGSSKITPDSFDIIRQVADIFIKYPTLRIQIEGHTDSSGGRDLNLRLSKARAQAVLDFMLEYSPNLHRDRFSVVGYGPDKPIALNTTVEGRKMNRRVEFVVLNKEELKNITPVE
ncbi:MAG: OmpA family protein [Candidatus Latescibacteria bacterium]|nr:OmpA family protein [Candidatus Latescibacterota bacterium]